MNRSIRSISACCFSIALPSAISRAACSRRQSCQVPLKKRARPASSSSTAVPTASRNQRSWATRMTAASRASSVSSSHSSDSMSRWFVGSSSSSRSGCGGERAGERGARELAAGEGLQRAVEVRVGEPEAVDDGPRALAPAVAAGGLEARVDVAVAVERRLVARGHRVSRRPSSASSSSGSRQPERTYSRSEMSRSRGGRWSCRAMRTPLDEHELAAVDRRLAGEHPQQRGLAGAVAPGDRQPLAALELERHTAQERLAGHVLGEV